MLLLLALTLLPCVLLVFTTMIYLLLPLFLSVPVLRHCISLICRKTNRIGRIVVYPVAFTFHNTVTVFARVVFVRKESVVNSVCVCALVNLATAPLCIVRTAAISWRTSRTCRAPAAATASATSTIGGHGLVTAARATRRSSRLTVVLYPPPSRCVHHPHLLALDHPGLTCET